MNEPVVHDHYFGTDHIALLTAPDDCYSYHVTTFVNWMTETGNTDPVQCVADYFRSLNESNYAAGTIRMKRQAVKNRLRLIADSEITNPTDRYRFDLVLSRLDRDPGTKAPKINTRAIGSQKVMTSAEYDRVLAAATDRQRMFLRFLWETGCRVSELTGALVRNAKASGSVVDVRIIGKGSKERHVRITTGLYTEIRAVFSGDTYLFETQGGKEYRRSYVSDQIKKLTLRTIGRGLSAHCLRHTWATRAIERTRKISAVSEYLGHASVSTTLAMYNHETLTDADLFGEGYR